MKKFLSVLLIVISLFSFSFAEESDPIIGTWYMLLDVSGTIMESSYPDHSQIIEMMTFDENGNIFGIEIPYSKKIGEEIQSSTLSLVGQWEKKDSGYSISVITYGVSDSYIENNLLYYSGFGSGIYMAFRKMEPLNIYTEIRR